MPDHLYTDARLRILYSLASCTYTDASYCCHFPALAFGADDLAFCTVWSAVYAQIPPYFGVFIWHNVQFVMPFVYRS